jgi:cytochrome oxidase Cu insertion factor (SCO1/SenC/PrrC family)
VIKKNAILIILLLLGAFLFVALQKYTKEFRSSRVEPEVSITDVHTARYLAKDFTLPDLNGTPTQLADYHGSVVLMMFWTTW